MEPDNLGGIIPPRKRIHYIAPRGDWLGSKLGGRINHPQKLIGLSVFCMADCGELWGVEKYILYAQNQCEHPFPIM